MLSEPGCDRFEKVTRMAQRYPASTRVVDMGLNPADSAKLSDAGKQLTKDDLVQLWAGTTTSNAQGATLGDIEVIKKAFQPAMAASSSSAEGGDTTACCCTPCCCATAVMKPLAQLA
jgi:hypothetical protein